MAPPIDAQVPPGEPEAPAEPRPITECHVVEGDTAGAWYHRTPGDTWTEGGSHFAVCRSEARERQGGVEGHAWRESRESAEAGALSCAYWFAFERLAARDVRFADWRVDGMVEERVGEHGRGDPIEFPRIEIADRVIETCEQRAVEGGTWRATLLVEYPIALLRGDVNNALWHERRCRNEAEVLVSSARSLLGEGRWLDALIELERARGLLSTVNGLSGSGGPVGEIDSLRVWAAGALTVGPTGGVGVVEIGERRETTIAFRWTYEWEGRTVPATRLPVSFRPHGFDAVFDSDAETDEAGVATCRIVVAYGPVGEHFVEPRLDRGVLAEALGRAFALEVEPHSGPLHPVYLVEGAHALTVCVEIRGLDVPDQAQVLAGFARRMERDGFRLEDCGPDVDVVVSAEAGRRSFEDGQEWTASVALEVSAFDQRVARKIGAPSILAEESASKGRRESEVLALKEAGRLLGVYLSHRILMSGS